ncbi:MAG: hypothetical protein KBT48_05400 [Firmicutes bacterium]|nr:hypothetical protein [Bacillota bacterium]
MENRNSQDLRILKNAKQHVSFSTTFMFLLLILYFVSLFYVNNQVSFLAVSDSFKSTCYILAAIQIFAFAFIDMLIMKGRKNARILYWLVFILAIGEYYFPMVAISNDPIHFLTYIALMLMMLLKLATMARFGSYLNHNKFCKILFDHVLEVYSEEDQEDTQEIFVEPTIKPNPTIPPILKEEDLFGEWMDTESKQQFIQPEKEEDIVIDVIEEFTFPQLAIKLAAVVYGSLAGFPILANLLSELLCSTDGKVVFAIKDIFMLCILSAVLWTFAILFLYYDHPKSKTLCNVCFVGEAIGILFYLPKFIGYMHSETIQYAPRVFILFGILNLVRYSLLALIIKPIYIAVEDEVKPDEN